MFFNGAVNDRLSYEIHRTLAPRIYEGGAQWKHWGGGSDCAEDSPSQKSKIFASPLVNAGAEAAVPLVPIKDRLSLQRTPVMSF